MSDEASEQLRKKAADQITAEDLVGLIGELKAIAMDREVAAQHRLQAIGMILDRSWPKLAVDNTKIEVVEETGTRKKLKEEIRRLIEEDESE